jgi:hypothetical protein
MLGGELMFESCGMSLELDDIDADLERVEA